MKKFYYLVAGVLSMGMLAACSNEDDIAAGNGNEQKGEAYLQLTIAGTTNGSSRTLVPVQPGSEGENKISEATILLCNGENSTTISRVITDVKLTGNEDGTWVTAPIDVAEGKYSVYVIANPGSYSPEVGDDVTTEVIGSVTKLTETSITGEGGYATAGNFIMFNACNGTDDVNGAQVEVFSTNDYDNPAETGVIKLDRLVAKIMYDTENTGVLTGDALGDADNQLTGLTQIKIEGFNLLNGITSTNLQQEWSAAAPAPTPETQPTTGITNLLVTPTSPTFYRGWDYYSTVTNEGTDDEPNYTSVIDKAKSMTFNTEDQPLYCMENNSGAGVEDNYLQGNTTGVLFKARAEVTNCDQFTIGEKTVKCFYGYRPANYPIEYYATLDAMQAAHPTVFDDNNEETDTQAELAAAKAELTEDLTNNTVSDFRKNHMVYVFEDCVMYYTHYIEDQNYRTEAGDKYHAVMRNTIYGLTVNGVANIGDDVPGGWNPDRDPEEPVTPPTYLTVTCEPNDWVLSSYGVTLQ